ncbi:MAG: alkylhydroperoxidase, partial [Thermomicrobiales bacterium]
KRDVILRFLDQGIDAELPEMERAVVDLATKLTLDPEDFGPEDLQPLRDLGLDDLTILDAINYTAFFGNANRLMLTLGEPRRPQKRS